MAVAHMYALAISVDMEHQGYNCIHYSEEILSLQKRGRYLDFYAQFHQQLLDSDKALLSGIFDAKLYSRQTYAEGEMRIWDKNKNCTIIPITVPGYLQSKAKKSCCCCVTSTIKTAGT